MRVFIEHNYNIEMEIYPLYILILSAVFGIAWLIQIVYQLSVPRQVLSRCKSEKRKEDVTFIDEKPGVSVIVYANNQSETLLRNLPTLLDNDYPDFEVIVVDDMSVDDTQDVLMLMEQRSDHFFHTKLTDKVRTMSHRKLALLLGVKAAHHDIVLTTKAQCIPASKDWISSMARNFTQWTDIVIGPVIFEGRTGVFSRFYQYDLFQRMITLFGQTLAIRPFAGWGNNMAFRKKILFADNNRAFSSQLNLRYGEDDLLVSAMARRHNVMVECAPESVVVDQESPLKYAWSNDRLIRAFTGKRYTLTSKFFKWLDISTRYLCVIAGLMLMVVSLLKTAWVWLAIVLTLLFLRLFTISFLAYQTSREMGIHRYLLSPIFCDLLIPFVDLWFWLRASFRNKMFYVSRV